MNMTDYHYIENFLEPSFIVHIHCLPSLVSKFNLKIHNNIVHHNLCRNLDTKDHYLILNNKIINPNFLLSCCQYHQQLVHDACFYICVCAMKKDAKETLLDPAKRANYDKWRNSGINVSYKNWLGMKEHVHQVSK